MAALTSDSDMLIQFSSEMPYNNNAKCALNFQCPNEEKVIVDVTSFGLEDHEDCSYDYVSFDGNKHCGSNIPVYQTVNSKIEIVFKSDESVTEMGFKLYLGCAGYKGKCGYKGKLLNTSIL